VEEMGMGNFAHFAKTFGFHRNFNLAATLVILREREREREREKHRQTHRQEDFVC
jgi:hypothetical protein